MGASYVNSSLHEWSPSNTLPSIVQQVRHTPIFLPDQCVVWSWSRHGAALAWMLAHVFPDAGGDAARQSRAVVVASRVPRETVVANAVVPSRMAALAATGAKAEEP
jgi:hypothetical protein